MQARGTGLPLHRQSCCHTFVSRIRVEYSGLDEEGLSLLLNALKDSTVVQSAESVLVASRWHSTFWPQRFGSLFRLISFLALSSSIPFSPPLFSTTSFRRQRFTLAQAETLIEAVRHNKGLKSLKYGLGSMGLQAMSSHLRPPRFTLPFRSLIDVSIEFSIYLKLYRLLERRSSDGLILNSHSLSVSLHDLFPTHAT